MRFRQARRTQTPPVKHEKFGGRKRTHHRLVGRVLRAEPGGHRPLQESGESRKAGNSSLSRPDFWLNKHRALC